MLWTSPVGGKDMYLPYLTQGPYLSLAGLTNFGLAVHAWCRNFRKLWGFEETFAWYVNQDSFSTCSPDFSHKVDYCGSGYINQDMNIWSSTRGCAGPEWMDKSCMQPMGGFWSSSSLQKILYVCTCIQSIHTYIYNLYIITYIYTYIPPKDCIGLPYTYICVCIEMNHFLGNMAISWARFTILNTPEI